MSVVAFLMKQDRDRDYLSSSHCHFNKVILSSVVSSNATLNYLLNKSQLTFLYQFPTSVFI